MTRPAEASRARSLDPLERQGLSPPLQLAATDRESMRDSLPLDDLSGCDANDAELMMRVRWGDADAFEQVMERYWERTFRYARHLQDDADWAYDIAQEAFARLWERRREWEPSGSVSGWLLRTARNLVIAEQRKWKVRMRWKSTVAKESESYYRTPLQDVESKEIRLAIQRAVQALSPRRREVFTLFHIQHLSYREIGEILDIRPQTIANHLQAAVAELRTVLGAFGSTTSEGEKSRRSSLDEAPTLKS